MEEEKITKRPRRSRELSEADYPVAEYHLKELSSFPYSSGRMLYGYNAKKRGESPYK